MSLSERINRAGVKAPINRTSPLWKGPESREEQGGITFSLLNRFLTDKERFRLLVVEGLKPSPNFYPPIDYGTMWHLCEEVWASNPKNGLAQVMDRLRFHCQQLCRLYPTQQDQVSHWYEMCKAQFPLYVEYWSSQEGEDKENNHKPLLQEESFKVEYALPSGRKVFLRGKWDSVHEVDGEVWLQENKSKSQINQYKLTQQLSFDLQTMIYLIALREYQLGSFWSRSNKRWRNLPIAGVRYNVIRRSAHKSSESMVKKIQEDKEEGRIGEWFSRWKVEVSKKDLTKFKEECLNPLLEHLCCWWDHIVSCISRKVDPFSGRQHLHFRTPYGIYSSLMEDTKGDLDGYLATGSEVGLSRSDTLFPEL